MSRQFYKQIYKEEIYEEDLCLNDLFLYINKYMKKKQVIQTKILFLTVIYAWAKLESEEKVDNTATPAGAQHWKSHFSWKFPCLWRASHFYGPVKPKLVYHWHWAIMYVPDDMRHNNVRTLIGAFVKNYLFSSAYCSPSCYSPLHSLVPIWWFLSEELHEWKCSSESRTEREVRSQRWLPCLNIFL